ncbi:MAG: hypothetical protein DME89_01435 [Verrucomicrobia bacterium]|nr:MAG: hypothetical protein DME89_01435 [Verrucomicrobiota bacterium]
MRKSRDLTYAQITPKKFHRWIKRWIKLERDQVRESSLAILSPNGGGSPASQDRATLGFALQAGKHSLVSHIGRIAIYAEVREIRRVVWL